MTRWIQSDADMNTVDADMNTELCSVNRTFEYKLSINAACGVQMPTWIQNI